MFKLNGRRPGRVLIFLAALFVVPMSTLAQEPGLEEPPPRGTAVEPDQDAETGQELEVPARRISQLVDSPVVSRTGEFQAEIRDMVIATSGEIAYFVLSLDEGETEERYLVPADRFSFGTAYQSVEVDVTRNALEGFETVTDDMLPAALGQEAGATQLLLGSYLLDYTAFGREGEELGDIEDVMLNLRDLRVAYLGLATGGGFLGLGERLIAVPLEAVTRLDTRQQSLVLNVAEEQLDEVEGFDPDYWPLEADGWSR